MFTFSLNTKKLSNTRRFKNIIQFKSDASMLGLENFYFYFFHVWVRRLLFVELLYFKTRTESYTHTANGSHTETRSCNPLMFHGFRHEGVVLSYPVHNSHVSSSV